MSDTWSLKFLRERIQSLGLSDADDVIARINSIGRAVLIYEYHKRLARDAFEIFSTENDPSGRCLTTHFFGMADDGIVLWEAGIVSEANLIAAINITKGMFDSFGQLVNRLVLCEPIVGNVYLHLVLKKLPPSPLRSELSAATSSEWFNYITAFINSVKHSQLVTHGASVSFVDDNRGGKLKEFTHNGKHYPSYWAREILEGVVEIQKSLIVCGQALNNAEFQRYKHQ